MVRLNGAKGLKSIGQVNADSGRILAYSYAPLSQDDD